MKDKSKYIIVTFVFSLLLMQTSCKNKSTVTEEAPAEATASNMVELTDNQLKNASIESDSLRMMPINRKAKLNGKVEIMPEFLITVSSPMPGIVKQIKWMPGSNVIKGQTLVSIENQEFVQLQEAYLNAKNALGFAKIEYDRQVELAKNDANSTKALQQAEEKWRAQSIALKSMGERLSIININTAKLTPDNITSTIQISAPASGPITKVNVNTGKWVESGAALVEMLDPKGMKLVLRAFEKDLPYINLGQSITAKANANPNQSCNGKVESVVKSIESEGFSSVFCRLDGCKGLISGLYMNAEINLNNSQTYVVPNDAIVHYEGKDFVFVQQNTHAFEMVEITTGVKEKQHTEVSNYQNLIGHKIVGKGAYTLLMAMKNVADE